MAKIRFSIRRVSAILTLKKIHIWSCDCYRVPNVLLCIKFYQNRNDIWLRYGDLTICNMAAVRHVKFLKFRVYVT